MRCFWLLPLLCLPAMTWAQAEEGALSPAPAAIEEEAPEAVSVEGNETTVLIDDEAPALLAVEEDEATMLLEEEASASASAEDEGEAATPAEDEEAAVAQTDKEALVEALTLIEEEAGPWSGDIAFGFMSSSGNSEATSYNTKLGLVYSTEEIKNSFTAILIYGEQDNVRSAERYALTNQTDRNFDERNFAFLALDAEKDLFGAVRERTSQTIGYGRRLLLGPVHTLNVNAGAGSRQQLPQEGGGRDYDFIGRLSADYVWKISETSSFSQKLRIETGVENTFTESVTELKLSIIGNVSANLSFTARDNSVASFDSQRTDTFTAINLAYGFGA